MSAQDIATNLARHRWHQSFVLPNYTPSKWWECDLFEITKAGIFREYEIKITRSDFKADALKKRRRWTGSFSKPDEQVKHAQIGSIYGPQRFWYVTPVGLVHVNEVPEWAGLIQVNNMYEAEIKKAPKLHNSKIDPEVETHARGVCYFRLMRMRIDKFIQRHGEPEMIDGDGI